MIIGLTNKGFDYPSLDMLCQELIKIWDDGEIILNMKWMEEENLVDVFTHLLEMNDVPDKKILTLLSYIDHQYITKYVVDGLLETFEEAFAYLPALHKTYENALYAASQHVANIGVFSGFITEELLLKLLNNEFWRTYIAVQHDEKYLRDYFYIDVQDFVWKHIPNEILTKEFFEKMLRQNHESIIAISEKYLTLELCQYVVDIDKEYCGIPQIRNVLRNNFLKVVTEQNE